MARLPLRPFCILTLLISTPTATSLRPTPPRVSVVTASAPPLSSRGLGRRGWATASALGLAAAVGAPRSAVAFAKDAEQGALKSLERQVELKRRPQPLLTRKKMEQDFAVLLMRTSYAVVDDLDFVAMDGFQKAFFLFRQSEYLDYLAQLQGAPMAQGDLRDPKYLDFISFAQHDTISTCMKSAAYVFDEAVMVPPAANAASPDDEPPTWTTQVVRRDPNVMPNAQLPVAFDARVGDALLDWLLERYNTAGGGGGLDLTVSLAPHPTLAQAAAGCEQLLAWLQVNLYLSGFDVAPSARGASDLAVRVAAPATRWSQEVLAQRRGLVDNAYEVKVLLAYLRRVGVDAAAVGQPKFDGPDVVHTLRLRAGLAAAA